MLIEFILPDHLTDAIDELTADAVETFGGATMSSAHIGHWKNPDTEQVECERVRTIAVDVGTASADHVTRWIRERSDRLLSQTDEHTIYARVSDCVSLLTTRKGKG